MLIVVTFLVFLAVSQTGCLLWNRTIVVVTEGIYSENVLLSRDWPSLLSRVYNTIFVDIEILRTEGRNSAQNIAILCNKHKEQILAVVDTLGDCYFADIASRLFQPYTRVSTRRCLDPNILYIRPPLTFYTDAAFNFTNGEKTIISKSILIYDQVFGQDALSDVLHDSNPHLLTRMMTSQDEDLTSWLSHLSTRQTLHFVVVVGRMNRINTLFEKVCSITIPDTFHWTVVLTDDFHFNWTLCPLKHLVIFRHRLDRSKTHITELSVNVAAAYLIDALSLTMVILNTTTLEQSQPQVCREGWGEKKKIDDFSSGMSGILVQLQDGKPFTSQLQILQIEYPDPKVIQLGVWSRKVGVILHNSTFTQPDNSYKISVVTKHEPPFVIRTETAEGPVYSGYSIDVLDEVARRLNLQYDIYEPPDGQYGKQRPDGTWSGLIGEILTGYADIAVASLSMTTERDNVVDFTTPYYEFGGIQILMHSNTPSTSILAFTTVFTKEVWACWASVLVLSGVLVFVCERFSPYSPRRDTRKKYAKKFTVKESMWMVIASFTMSGPECSPTTFSSRVMTGGFWFFSSIMMATYTANLAAFLTTSRLSVPIESLDDLAKQSSIKYSVVKGTAIHDYFERMANIESNLYQQWKEMSFQNNLLGAATELAHNYAVWDYPLGDKYMTIWKSIQKTGLINDSKEGINKALKENFAFIHESPLVQYELSQHCDLMSIGKEFSSRPYAFALPQGSPLTSLISYTILELQSEPILEKLKTKWWKTDSITCTEVDESRGLTFNTVGGIFLLVITGIVLGIISLVLERVWTSFASMPKVRHNVNITSPNSRTNLASDFDSGFTYLANGCFTGESSNSQDTTTVELETF